MKSLYIALLAILLLAMPTLAQEKPSKPVKFKKGQAEQGVTAADGRRIGKWNFYGAKDELELTFDYDSSRIHFMQPDTTRYLVREGDQWELKHLTRAPRLLGSTKQRYMDIGTTIRYPAMAIRQQQQGRVIVAFTVDTDGHTKDYTIENSVSPECDQEVWRVIKDLPDNWIPAIYQGRLVPARFYLYATFRLLPAGNPSSQGQPSPGPPLVKASAVTDGAHYLQELVIMGQMSTRVSVR